MFTYILIQNQKPIVENVRSSPSVSAKFDAFRLSNWFGFISRIDVLLVQVGDFSAVGESAF